MSKPDCSICLSPIINNGVSLTNCKHQFHFKCIATWLNSSSLTQSSKTCPLCRTTSSVFNTRYYVSDSVKFKNKINKKYYNFKKENFSGLDVKENDINNIFNLDIIEWGTINKNMTAIFKFGDYNITWYLYIYILCNEKLPSEINLLSKHNSDITPIDLDKELKNENTKRFNLVVLDTEEEAYYIKKNQLYWDFVWIYKIFRRASNLYNFEYHNSFNTLIYQITLLTIKEMTPYLNFQNHNNLLYSYIISIYTIINSFNDDLDISIKDILKLSDKIITPNDIDMFQLNTITNIQKKILVI